MAKRSCTVRGRTFYNKIRAVRCPHGEISICVPERPHWDRLSTKRARQFATAILAMCDEIEKETPCT